MSYSQVSYHRTMVLDRRRNEAYANAMRKAITPDSVVMDLGAGLGIHGLLAAAAGARRVYLVEPEAVVLAAVEAATASGLADRIVVIRDRIENADIPEKVDLLVSALTGNLLFTEDLLAPLYLARDRYLKPCGQMVPHRAQLCLAAASTPTLHAQYFAPWEQPVMGLDFTFAGRLIRNDLCWPSPEEIRDAQILSGTACVADLDLTLTHATDCDGQETVEVMQDGLCHGLIGWLRLHTGSEWISSHPHEEPLHWSPAFLPIDPVQVRAGENLRLSLQRPRAGDWTWQVTIGASTQRHSTFLSRPGGLGELARIAPSAAPGLGPRGKTALLILRMLDEGRTIESIAAALPEEAGMQTADGLLLVQSLARRYGNRS